MYFERVEKEILQNQHADCFSMNQLNPIRCVAEFNHRQKISPEDFFAFFQRIFMEKNNEIDFDFIDEIRGKKRQYFYWLFNH